VRLLLDENLSPNHAAILREQGHDAVAVVEVGLTPPRTHYGYYRTRYGFYSPANQTRDGKFRKIKVELVNPETNEPLRVVDEKGKPIKYQIVAKTGYTAPREVE
jgi:hypothetical protein